LRSSCNPFAALRVPPLLMGFHSFLLLSPLPWLRALVIREASATPFLPFPPLLDAYFICGDFFPPGVWVGRLLFFHIFPSDPLTPQGVYCPVILCISVLPPWGLDPSSEFFSFLVSFSPFIPPPPIILTVRSMFFVRFLP